MLPRSSDMTVRPLLVSMLACTTSHALAQQGDRADEAQPPLPSTLESPDAPPLSPTQALEAFEVAPGLRVELVAAEPMVVAPVAMDFAPDGRLWVVEMTGYMNDVHGTGELDQVGRIVVLEDTDADGYMDTRTVFLDQLVLPRAVHALDDGALVVSPPLLIHARDTDGDGHADSRVILDDTFLGLQSPEHAGNGLRFGMDNWLHCSQHPWEYRFDGTTLQKQRVPAHGQWGLTRDAWDRWYYTPNSYPLLVDLVPKQYATRNPAITGFRGTYVQVPADLEVHSIRINPGVNRGYKPETLNDDYTLSTFTAACGPEIYLDDVLGEYLRGTAFICEPSGNCIELRQLIPRGSDAPEARIIGDGTPPLASTDERFRPVQACLGPDGALYVLDMYRGILQHKIFMTTFLRDQVLDRALELPVDRGRIWRLVPDDRQVLSLPDLEALDERRLVDLLKEDNGTLRLLAQRRLLALNTPSSVELLRSLARSNEAPVTRAHALWTLEGLDALDESALLNAMGSTDPDLRVQAIRLAETMPGSSNVRAAVHEAVQDENRAVRWHAAATLGTVDPDHAVASLAQALASHPDDVVLRSTSLSAAGGHEIDLLEAVAWHEGWTTATPDRKATIRKITRTVARTGNPDQLTRLLELLAALPSSMDWKTTVIATRLTDEYRLRSGRPKPIELTEAPFDWSPRLEDEPDIAGGLLRLIDVHATWPGREGYEVEIETTGLLPHEAALVERGASLYAHCLGCHQALGTGLRGFYPPLDSSELVLGNPEPLVAILLHGIEGPMTIDGVKYNQQMPPAPFTDDRDIAAIASYIRTAWQNDASMVDTDLVAAVRTATAGHKGPWKIKTLREAYPSVP